MRTSRRALSALKSWKMLSPELMLRRSEQIMREKRFILISMDLEWHELSQNKITEIGLSVLDSSAPETTFLPDIQDYHLITVGWRELLNGRHVADNRKHSSQTVSNVMSLDESKKFVFELFRYYHLRSRLQNVPFYLIGHQLGNDFAVLQEHGFEFGCQMEVLDTAVMWQYPGKNSIALWKMLEAVKIQMRFLHNAANDAHATLLAFLRFSDPVFRAQNNFATFDHIIKNAAQIRAAQAERRLAKVSLSAEPGAQKEKKKSRMAAESPNYHIQVDTATLMEYVKRQPAAPQ